MCGCEILQGDEDMRKQSMEAQKKFGKMQGSMPKKQDDVSKLVRESMLLTLNLVCFNGQRKKFDSADYFAQ